MFLCTLQFSLLSPEIKRKDDLMEELDLYLRHIDGRERALIDAHLLHIFKDLDDAATCNNHNVI